MHGFSMHDNKIQKVKNQKNELKIHIKNWA